MRRAFIVCFLLLFASGSAMSAYETKQSVGATGAWVWSSSVQGDESTALANALRFKTHHKSPIGTRKATLLRIAHTTAAADTIRFKLYYAAGVDSMLWISSTPAVVDIPCMADSLSFCPYKTSAPGDWFYQSYWSR